MGDRNMQGHYGLTDNLPNSMHQVPNAQTAQLEAEKFLELPSASIEQRANNSAKQDEDENSFKGFTTSENSTEFNTGISSMEAAILSKSSGVEQQLNMNFQSVSSLQAELGDILYNKTSGFIATEEQINEFDCFKDMDGAKEGMIWWTNGFDTKSSSSSSWDSASALQTEGLFPDCVLGYDINTYGS
ncbi:hypothetical protein FRX31_004960 [Thalictrum thalictroides]|uniref:Uncharacterized protein n=1 Tax=Thalictrum thalictroides TaxID=46969 RepID=A0A7J6X6S8_THATH|nr:hypothetical protein FRX31_004960 [Thalictrum thalictroides]